MADKILSQVALKDPFTLARNAYEEKQSNSANQTVLSNTPFSPESNLNLTENNLSQVIQPDFQVLLKNMGIESNGIAMSDVGRVQLISRLKKKLGNDYLSNPDAQSALDAFEQSVASLKPEDSKLNNKMISNANRTIGALFGV